MDNIPASELEMALVALLNALREYNNALGLAGREASLLVLQLTEQLSNELSNEPDRSSKDHE